METSCNTSNSEYTNILNYCSQLTTGNNNPLLVRTAGNKTNHTVSLRQSFNGAIYRFVCSLSCFIIKK